ncbi:RNA-binding protein [Brachybacterium vulturis]|uniref:RNA-binding protein n=1 Tax=Brachybacterium vulturis TaxID=2017484 RepID=A0A291GL07_9MICO|nr:ASCH domain-containing protein [Brachybacterium vulturis]ATG50750.1 RNA-binding protein [Brachybacterium vulturis]
MTAENIARFWADVRSTLLSRPVGGGAITLELPEEPPEAWAFGATPEHADGLLALVLEGTKTGTASSLADCDAEGESIPAIGDLSIILDGAEAPRAVLEVTAIDVLSFEDVTEEHAHAEGEHDRTLASWRSIHESFWREHSAQGFAPDMLVACERFRVIFPVTDARR